MQRVVFVLLHFRDPGSTIPTPPLSLGDLRAQWRTRAVGMAAQFQSPSHLSLPFLSKTQASCTPILLKDSGF